MRTLHIVNLCSVYLSGSATVRNRLQMLLFFYVPQLGSEINGQILNADYGSGIGNRL